MAASVFELLAILSRFAFRQLVVGNQHPSTNAGLIVVTDSLQGAEHFYQLKDQLADCASSASTMRVAV